MQDTNPDMGIRGFSHGFPESHKGFNDGPSAEPPVARNSWEPGSTTPLGSSSPSRTSGLGSSRADDAAPASGVDVAGPLADEVRGDRARVRGAVDVVEGTISCEANGVYEQSMRANRWMNSMWTNRKL
jgi:hypothetical protein